MKFKPLLLTSTAMLMLGTPVAPLFAQNTSGILAVAQAAPPAVSSAISAYRDAEAALAAARDTGGDVAAAEANFASAEAELSALCQALGQDIQSCLSAFANGGGEVAASPAEEPVAEEAPEPEEPPAPAPEASEPEIVEPEPAPQEAAPIPEPAPVEEPAPVQEQAPVEDAAPAEEPAPLPAIEEPAPAQAEQPAEEPAPAPVEAEQPPAPEPSPVEQPAQDTPPAPTPQEQPVAPAEQPSETPAAPAAEQSGVPAGLAQALSAYDSAVANFEAAIASGGDTSAAAQAVLDAEAELEGVCSALGQSDLVACLAGFGINFQPIDVDAAVQGQVPAPVEGQPAPEGQAPAPAPVEDNIILDGDVQGEIVPEGTDASEVAPLLDSAKDAVSGVLGADDDAGAVEGQVEGQAQAEVQTPPAPAPRDVDITQIPSIETDTAESRQDVSIQEIEDAGAASAAATLQQFAPGQAPQPQQAQQGGVLVGPVREGPTNAEIIATIGLATIFAIGANQFINTPDTSRIVYPDDQQYYTENLSDGRTRETILRADGSRIVTIRDQYGDIIRRSRIEPDGREILLVYVDPSYQRYDDQGRWIDPGRQLPPLQLNIPASEYVLNASAANETQVASFLNQPPVESIQRYYTIDEVKRSSRLRDMVRRLEIADLTFETGSANITQSEIGTLSATASAMLDLIAQNPAETFLIEGHTDAVGSDLSNLALSDRRAEAVAYALTRVYGVPAENLATQGYGERYLKINTQVAERANRRVTIRRITPLITPMNVPAG